MFLESAADLHRALRRRFRTRVKCQRHPVASWDPGQTARGFGSLKLLGRANNPLQFLNRPVLVANRKLRIANDVDEQDMGDFELDLVLDLNGHLVGGCALSLHEFHNCASFRLLRLSAMISHYFTRRILIFCSPRSNYKSDMRGRNDARDIHDCDCVSLHRSGNHAFRDFSSLRTHFRAAYCMRLLCAAMGMSTNLRGKRRGVLVSTGAEFSSVRAEAREDFSYQESHGKRLVRKRTREFQPCAFCFRIFLPATRSRTARRNFSRSAALPMSSLRFIASATVLA